MHKRPSTPDDPARAVLAGIAGRGWRPNEVVHGSTIATNTVLERKGARTAFVATKGFRDLLAIGRQARPSLYELEPQRPPLLIPRELCFEAAERIDYRGVALQDLTHEEATRVAGAVAASGAEAVAVCLLFSFLQPRHEAMLARALRAQGLDVSASHEVLPEFREYERVSTTALNAYVAPIVRRYLRSLDQKLAQIGSPRLRIIQSSGGVAGVEQAAHLPAALLLSGPAGGVAGGFATARTAGFESAITLDMGGTSTDIALCPGRVPYTTELTVAGLPARLPSVDVHTVGAGGGSIAWLDAGGALRVGPRSAGADPGPACYGRGGPPTMTDAHLVLGRLAPDAVLGGNVKVDLPAAWSGLEGLGMGAVEAARGAIDVANSSMERALRVVSVERGFDPRDFTLVAFGGAGPLHACDLAQALSIRRVLVPRYPGIMSAIGMAMADTTRDASLSLMEAVEEATESRITKAIHALAADLREDLGPHAESEAALDMRYAGQGYELTIPWDRGLTPTLQAFHQAHKLRYGHADASRVVEVTVVRVTARLRRPPHSTPRLAEAGPDPAAALTGKRAVWFDTERDTALYDRGRLLAGNVIEGPAIVAQMDSTTLVSPGWRAIVDSNGNLILESGTHA